MPLRLIHGPPNSGRAELLEGLFREALERDPVLVLPTRDDVYGFERRLSAAGALLGGAVLTFADLFRAVHAAAGGEGARELTAAQRLAAVGAAIRGRRGRLGPLRRSAARPGFTVPFERLLDELQSAGLEPESLGSGAGTLEASAYLGDLTELFAGYAELRDRLGCGDAHTIAREATTLLRADPGSWRARPVFLYEPGELTANQRDLLGELAAATEVTVAVAYEADDPALATRASLVEALRTIGVDEEVHTEAARPLPDAAPTILRSAGERGEAESIGAQVAKLVAAGADPAAIAIALRDPVRRGPLLVEVLESYGIAVALEAELPLAATAVGGALLALLETEFGGGGVDDLLRFLRGPSGLSRRRVDWFERALRRRRVRGASAALALWEERYEDLPGDLVRLRAAAAEGDAALVASVGRLAATMASRPLRGEADGPALERGDGLELRAAAALATALEELAALPELAPRPAELAATLRQLRFRAWSGPIEGRVRIASPYRLRASRFDHVFVASLQDGEFPRRDRGGDPFLAEPQRRVLGLEPRRDPEAEERYLFHACLALPRERLFLSYRDSDENGVAEPRSPFLDEFDGAPTVGRDLTQIVHAPREAPSPRELARAIAARGPGADAAALLAEAGVGEGAGTCVRGWLETAERAERASRAPGPIANPAVLESLAAVSAYGGTTLEGFDVCSYRWLVSHELDPQPLDPAPDPLVQGGLMHAVLYQLYRERPGGDPLPRRASLAAWLGRGQELVGETIAARGLGGHPAERAIARRVEGLLARFLADEAERQTGGFEPWLLEAGFGESEETERPKLEIDGWALHGAIDRVDRGPDGRALVLDYKLARAVTPRKKFEEQAKLQLQLYLIAVAELWGAEPVGGLYHPLRGTSERRPRGAVLADDAAELGYRLYDPDLVDAEGFAELLADARRRAGEIVARMRRGDVRRDPGPRHGLRGHDICPAYCDFAPICRRDRAPVPVEDGESER